MKFKLFFFPTSFKTPRKVTSLELTLVCAVLLLQRCLSAKSGITLETSTFSDVVKSAAYIDKTSFIEAFARLPKHVLITGPRGFSKSTNLDMLQYYFEHELDIDNNALSPEKSTKLEVFKNTNFFKNNNTLFWQHFAKYPILRLDLGPLLTATSFSAFLTSYRAICIRPLEVKFQYLVNSTKVDSTDLAEIRKIFNPSFVWDEAALATIPELLADHLRYYHGVRPILLVDECDAPVASTLFRNYADTLDSDRILEFFRCSIADLTRKDEVERTLMTGRVRIGSPHMNVGQGLATSTIFDTKELSEAYGFTKDDLQTLKDKFKLSDQDVTDIETHYGGYYTYDDGMIFQKKGADFNTTERSPSAKILNTRSVLKRLDSGRLDDWWDNAKGMDNLQWLISPGDPLAEKFVACVRSNCSINATKDVEIAEFWGIKMGIQSADHNAISESRFLNMFLESGYFTVIEKNGTHIWIAPPNVEIRNQLEKKLRQLKLN